MFRATIQRSLLATMFAVSSVCLAATGADPQTQAGARPARDPSSSIDQFILHRLDRRDLQVARAAERQTSIRRILLDVTSLPIEAAPTTAPSTRPADPEKWSGTLRLEVEPQMVDRWQEVALAVPTTQRITDNDFVVERLQGAQLNPDVEYVNLFVADDNKKAAYLGVGVEAPSDTVRSQLDLPDGAGLVVNYVDENGPSKDEIRKHDVLRKLDDQILINADQLIALVRMHKPGETVSLTLLRQARPATVEIKLGEKKAESPNKDFEKYLQLKVLSDGTAAPLGGVEVLSKVPVAGRLYAAEADGRPITFNDGEVLAFLDGHGNLLAVDVKTGNQLFHGPIATERQWQQVPELVRNKLSSWREMIAPKPADADSAESSKADETK